MQQNPNLEALHLKAKRGDRKAQYDLGLIYTEGRGVPKDERKAFKYYTMAAKQGLADAQYNLGVIYHEGRGVSRDVRRAMKWFKKAADQGHIYAQHTLGMRSNVPPREGIMDGPRIPVNAQYEKKIVAFLDILGFKDMVAGDARKSATELCQIQAMITKRIDMNPSHIMQIIGNWGVINDLGRYSTTFSDSAIISRSIKHDFRELRDLILNLCWLQQCLIEEHGVLLRGGITIGSAVHTSNGEFLFGEAINNAVDLEKKAKSPRIILSEDTIQLCKAADTLLPADSIDRMENDLKSNILKKDTDDYWYIDYLFSPQNPEKYFQAVQKMIIDGLNNTDECIKAKYEWLNEKYKAYSEQ